MTERFTEAHMKDRLNRLACLGALVIAVLAWVPAWVAAQAPVASGAPAKAWSVPRTPNGHPDLQGYWTSLSFTPLERPETFGSREFLTDQELEAVFKAGVDRSYEFTFANSADTPAYDATVYGLDAWQNGSSSSTRIRGSGSRLKAPTGRKRNGDGRKLFFADEAPPGAR